MGGQVSVCVCDRAGAGGYGGQLFTGFIGEVGQPLFWLFLFIAATAFIVMLGVEKGIEKASKILMPILVLLSLGIAVYVVTRPGAVDLSLIHI